MQFMCYFQAIQLRKLCNCPDLPRKDPRDEILALKAQLEEERKRQAIEKERKEKEEEERKKQAQLHKPATVNPPRVVGVAAGLKEEKS